MSEMHASTTTSSMSIKVRFSSLPCYELQADIGHPHGNLGLVSPLEVFDIDNVLNMIHSGNRTPIMEQDLRFITPISFIVPRGSEIDRL